jgi:hypothetical protein
VKPKRKKSDTRTYLDLDPKELLNLTGTMLKCIAQCDRETVPIPDEFLRAFGRVRDTMKRKCVGTSYSEEDFQKFFGVALEIAKREYGLSDDRARSLQGEANQSVQ